MKKEKILKIGFYISIFVVWEFYIRGFKVPNFLFPSPMLIMEEIGKNYPRLLYHLQQTLLEVLIGLGLGLITGIILSIISVHSRFFETTVYPLLVGLQTAPTIVIIPLLIIWVGLGIWTKIIIAGLISFFPIVVNTTKGLRGVNPEIMDYLKVQRANTWEVLWYTRIPNSFPDFFAGLETAVPLAVKGAIVAEFMASNRGIGYFINQASSYFNTALMFASIICLSIMGISLFQLVKVVEKRIGWLPKVEIC